MIILMFAVIVLALYLFLKYVLWAVDAADEPNLELHEPHFPLDGPYVPLTKEQWDEKLHKAWGTEPEKQSIKYQENSKKERDTYVPIPIPIPFPENRPEPIFTQGWFNDQYEAKKNLVEKEEIPEAETNFGESAGGGFTGDWDSNDSGDSGSVISDIADGISDAISNIDFSD